MEPAGSLQIRRVVTGHHPDGRATIVIDGMSPGTSGANGSGMTTMWATNTAPISNEGFADEAATAPRFDNGSVFRVVAHAPGAQARMHRTDTIDYLYIQSGEIDLLMDDGTTAHLVAGDTVVQRGTAHAWHNRGTEPCVILFVMIEAVPVAGVPYLEPLS